MVPSVSPNPCTYASASDRESVGNDKQRRFSPHAAITSAVHLFIQEPADYGDCDTGKRYDNIAKVNDGVVAVAFGLEL